ncbi:MAG: hypothetical protein E6Q97_12585, partial [Desulfurellales bacterium]
MAVSFRGTCSTLTIFGNDATTQNLFVIENGIASRVNIIVRRLTFGADALVALASVMNVLKTSRATSVSGGVILEKPKFVGTQTSDPAVVFRAQANETAPITATAGDTLWTQFANRLHSAVEQQLLEDDSERIKTRNLLPFMEHGVGELTIRPGESVLVRVVAATAASNARNSMNYAVRCSWEEDEIATFAISGTVTLSGSPVSGAIVTVVEADDIDMTNAVLRQVITTGAGGT